jgi:hypothetical protein
VRTESTPAEILWTLAGVVDTMRCELVQAPAGWALGLRMGKELISSELLPDEAQARERAHELRAQLLERGWLPRE